MPSPTEKKLEKFWRQFERTGSIEAYLQYQALKQRAMAPKAPAKKAAIRASR
jgi:hypothetical protein